MATISASLNKLKEIARGRIKDSRHLEGENSFIDKAIFQAFEKINDLGKFVSTERFKAQLYKQLMDYLLEVMPAYDSALPLLGSKDEEKILLAYKKQRFLRTAEPGDVILVRGNQRISRIIQTLTTSPYSHSTIYRGNGEIIEVEPEGVIVSPIDKYIHLDIRICRASMLDKKGIEQVSEYMELMLKKQPRYDITNIEKLLFKYLYTKIRPDTHVYIGGNTAFEKFYICSGMIAHAFHKAGYPIAPSLRFNKKKHAGRVHLTNVHDYAKLVMHCKKNFSQIVPSDFDNSPFFESVKFLYIDSCTKKPKINLQVDMETETN
ncbi:MAG: hypothetical protein OEY59_08640 [Deltaproteobacteria bacterium]|nr:hypothetical protein [Deltaproteobacteria bacterium]